MKERVGILGGSFDPVHCGHVRIANSFLASGLIDELLVIVSPYPPHKQNQRQADFSHRLEMLKLAFEHIKSVTISDLEQKLEKPSYTLHTIEHLQAENPGTIYFLCMGEDSLKHFDKWYRYREILGKTDLLVVERPGFDASEVDEEILEQTIFVDHEPYSISSTTVRSGVYHAEEDVPLAVAAYIKKNNLYQ